MGISIDELAKKIGLSTATISRAMNDEENVTPRTKALIMEAVEKYGYVPKTRRTTKAKMNADNVMVVVGNLSNPVNLNSFLGIQNKLASNGKYVFAVQTDYDLEKQEAYLQYAKDNRYSAVIMLNAIESESLMSYVANDKNPSVIFMNSALHSKTTNLVTADNYRCGYMAAKHLVENGHTHVIIVSGPKDSSVCDERTEGFTDALREHKVSVSPGDIFHGDMSYSYGEFVARKINFTPPQYRATAIYSINGAMAQGIRDGLAGNGIRIPDDISIVCNDDSSNEFGAQSTVTCIEPDYYSMGAMVASLYLSGSVETDNHRTLVYPPLLKDRGTVRQIGRKTERQ